LSLDQLSAAADALHREGRKIVLCHGVFDLVSYRALAPS